ncbi:hypothetical protein COS80_01020, partial [Candidatus Woesebacteria bacterium CG06_land_8_20_14_3_00_39_27]
MGRFFGKVSQL